MGQLNSKSAPYLYGMEDWVVCITSKIQGSLLRYLQISENKEPYTEVLIVGRRFSQCIDWVTRNHSYSHHEVPDPENPKPVSP